MVRHWTFLEWCRRRPYWYIRVNMLRHPLTSPSHEAVRGLKSCRISEPGPAVAGPNTTPPTPARCAAAMRVRHPRMPDAGWPSLSSVSRLGYILRLSYLEIIVDSRYFVHTNRKIILQNRYLHTFRLVNRNFSSLSWIYKRFLIFSKKDKKKTINPRQTGNITID
jgi:hypothetical protein